MLVDGVQSSSHTMATPAGGLNYIAVLSPSKGKHAFEVLATNVATGDTCSGYIPPGA